MRREPAGQFSLTKLWILYSVFCSVTGWILSGLHALNGTAWALSAVVFIFLLWRLPGLQPLAPFRQLKGNSLRALWLRRFCRPLPLCFMAAVILVFLRSFANPGSGGEVYSYRIPRVLHWIHDQGWTWIPSLDARMNNRGCEFEWMEVPLLMFDHSDRFIPLLTAIPFCLLPGLIFVTFRSLKIGARVAWHWCWLLPSAACIFTQAGTGSTDGVGVFYALAAVGLTLDARRRADVSYAYYGILSAALLINLKASNMPLLLPIGLAVWFSRDLLRQRLLTTVGLLLLASLVSFLPIALANIIHLHDWTGMAGETSIYKPANPIVAFAFNSVLVLVYFVAPPLLPTSQHVTNIFQSLHGTFLWNTLTTQFEANYGMIRRRIDEDLSGLGLGIALLLAPFIWKFLFCRTQRTASTDVAAKFISGGAWLALFVTMAKSTLFALPRVLAPYYPLLLAPFLSIRQATAITRTRWWRYLAIVQFVIALGIVMISSSSPPWPLSVVPLIQPHLPNSALTHFFVTSYTEKRSYLEFQRSFASQLPPDKEIGLVRKWDQSELPLWEPYGTRLISHVLPEDTRESLLQKGIHHIIIGPHTDPGPVLERFHATVEQESSYVEPLFFEKIHLYLVRLDSP